ncbi:cysteine hydrolase family protein [Clostridium beijerinckii]|jgi:Amidases related to nicotinamidase|uniref:Cysteine hydrolase n=2 Tax=Clostridium beijerinckii TaxID=1520 RepID=A0AAE2RSL6_CLOBE|nr:cysteine hydrolase family protein [Clostridium beijerinckii]ABR34536.1 isochorismatase hydrolase [Clostridium beijerinckii NCIMB 8052]AIU02699.1 isochorismatase hydrolase [Clostridium beijerinckii ATCC 35702]MBF7810838.1 cysteine hydrolase [Clostridium beijerinckii]NRT24125.1 nicotinamidase-related amidase [Clostridium beijerinckii]NRT68291.1 nicotinamidase-related amidase [Clostridium beijerinckii]
MKKALLVIDVQNEYFTGKLKVTYPNNSFDNILKVMDYAKENNMIVIIVQHTALFGDTFIKNSNGWELQPMILEKSYDYIIEKTKPSSFYETNLEEILKKENITEIVISGYMTQMCCDTTAREAFHRGYHVDFLSDATGTIDVNNEVGVISSKDLHKATLIAQSLKFSNVISTMEWMKLSKI